MLLFLLLEIHQLDPSGPTFEVHVVTGDENGVRNSGNNSIFYCNCLYALVL